MPVIAIPMELRRNFLANRTEFTRNMACWPMTSLHPYYRKLSTLYNALDADRENPWDYIHKRFPTGWHCQNPAVFRYMHFDLAENRDRVGFAMCSAPFHVNRDVAIGEQVEEMRVPYIFFDFLGIIEVAKGDELDFQLIPEIVFELRRRGFVIDLVTFDRFQSTFIIQILTNEGLHCGKLSIDRTAYKIVVRKVLSTKGETRGWKLHRESTEKQYADAHEALKSAVYEERCNVPTWTDWVQRHPMEPMHPFIREANGAEVGNAGTVDHGPFSSIDLLSGMAGAAYNCQNNSPDLGDRPRNWQDPSTLNPHLIHDERIANLVAMQEALRNTSSIEQFQAIMSSARFSEWGEIDSFDMERDMENNPFAELGL